MATPVIRPINDVILKRFYQGNRPLTDIGLFKKVVVIAPHMDDETIGVGGTIMKHVEQGAEVYCVFTSDGSGSEGGASGESLSRIRKSEIEKVNRILGMKQIYYMNLPDGYVHSTAEARETLKEILVHINPELIYCPPFVDAHPDHMGTVDILSDVLADSEGLSPMIRLYEINCPVPPGEINCIVDISDVYNKKKEAVSLFSSQVIAFDGFMKLNAIKSNLIGANSEAVETFLQVTSGDYVQQARKLARHAAYYPSTFKQVNREVTLLWAIFKNYRHKKVLYQERLF